MNLRHQKKIESISEADANDYQETIDWITQFIDPIGPARVEAEGLPDNAWGTLLKLLFGMFPTKIELTLVIVQEILLQIMEAKFDKDGNPRKIGWFRKGFIGGKMILAVGKIVKILRTK
jgi:hypothetical protein